MLIDTATRRYGRDGHGVAPAIAVPYSILVVDDHPVAVARLAQPLRSAGYDVTGATSFEAAKQQLTTSSPDLLIAAVRLGLFNGLHLVVRGRFDHPDMTAIVTAPVTDDSLEAEATACGAACVVSSANLTELLSLVSRTFASRPM